ncbi:O-glucosyltransferase 1-like protein [Drosera capensis]
MGVAYHGITLTGEFGYQMTILYSISPRKLIFPLFSGKATSKPLKYPRLICFSNTTLNRTCPDNNHYPSANWPLNGDPASTCPDYFRWIHEDVRPWKETGITREMVEKARRTAHFRLVILGGKVYVEKFRKAIQTRDVFTLWGIVQLVRLYPGRLPDLEMMFDCDDRPVIGSKDFMHPNAGPPPLFRYCSDWQSLDIVFPDWSFWGWAETNIKPWTNASTDIREGNKRTKWVDRVPCAYWRGNPFVCPWRGDLLKCNVSQTADWNARLYIQDWNQEAKQGYKDSNVGDQCTHRYKIYIEGWAWSVSEKYILGCDSMTLLVTPQFHDFFLRGMVPLQHYWPIRDTDKCRSLKFAVEWGNNYTTEAQAIGEAGSRFIHEDLKMEYVYDYMFHLLNEYSKLLRFKPVIPQGAVEVCSETMTCQAEGIWRKMMIDSSVRSPAESPPCAFPPAYGPPAVEANWERYGNLLRQVEMWEDLYWAQVEIEIELIT